MKVILLQDVPKVGKRFDIKTVSNGYGLNALIPQGKATVATEYAVARIEQQKEAAREAQETHDQKILETHQSLQDKIIHLTYNANEKGHLFQAIHESDVADAIMKEFDITVTPQEISFAKEIKSIGTHTVHLTAGQTRTPVTLEIQAEKK